MPKDHRAFHDSPSIHPAMRILAFALVVGVLWVAALSASPDLHEWVHPDAGDPDHDCAVTLFSSGQATHVGADLVLVVRPERLEVSDSIPYYETVLGSFFLGCSILEHAPPC
jgi:hypothetical protein